VLLAVVGSIVTRDFCFINANVIFDLCISSCLITLFYICEDVRVPGPYFLHVRIYNTVCFLFAFIYVICNVQFLNRLNKMSLHAKSWQLIFTSYTLKEF
jgi:hypothetical protein